MLTSLAGRLLRLEKHLDRGQQDEVRTHTGGLGLTELSRGLLDAADPDKILEAAQTSIGDADPAEAAHRLAEAACMPLASDPDLRLKLNEWQSRSEQVIDEVTQDHVLTAGFDGDATEAARRTVESFKAFIEQHCDEITALQIIYSIPAWGTSELLLPSRS